MKKTVEVMRNFPSDSFSKKEKKEALGDFLRPVSKDYNRVSKNDLYNALIYLYPMIDFGEDILHCMAKDGEIVNPMDYCDEYN